MGNIELKPCPFCGGIAILHANEGVKVICSECGCGTSTFSDYYVDNKPTGGAVMAAINQWNKRKYV